ncbi:MAG TPA: HPP family protein [Polyangia bacterium]|jgi:CBS-domain-containing membrane protein
MTSPHHHHGLEDLHELVHRLSGRLRRPGAARTAPLLIAGFSFLAGAASIGVMALAAWATRQPLIFPSLGPTAFLMFYSPRSPAACPRNAIAGHFIGVVCGYLALLVFGLRHAPPALAGGITLPWVGAAALSLALTGALMAALRVPHPPAGATTLIVSLGILPHPVELVTLLAAVVGLLLLGISINRLAGIPFPLWAPRRDAPS